MLFFILKNRKKECVQGEMDTKDWRQEQERLEGVRNKLQARIAELEPEVAGLRDQATDIRKRFFLYGVYAGHAPASSLHDGRLVAVRAGIACEFVRESAILTDRG